MNDQETDGLDLAIALQDALLPVGVPVLPMLDVGARFRFPDGAGEPVGNWLDVVALADGRIALVVGETPGTGIAAAAAMGQVSAVVRAGLRQDGTVTAALALADTFAAAGTDARGTTATVAVVDPAARTVTYATAGHPPPLVVPSSGTTTLLFHTGAGALGLGAGAGFTTTVCPLAPGDVVLLTCAAAAHRGRIVDLAGVATSDVATRLAETESALVGSTDGTEVLTLVAARLRGETHGGLSVRLPAARTASTARALLGEWLDELAPSPMDRMALVHATAELVTNSVEHGGLGEGEQVELRADLEPDGTAVVTVHDGGHWQPAGDDVERGRGLAMAAGLVDRLTLSTDADGTHAVLRHRLSRPVSIEPGAPRSTTPLAPLEIVRTPQTLTLRGGFEQDDVESVAAEVQVATRGGTRPVTIDLTDVTRLGTSPVRLLADLCAAHGTTGTGAGLRILTLRDSVADRTLGSAKVPHDAA